MVMLLIEEIDGGYRITEPEKRWTWWVYPSDMEIRNNGERYKLTGQQVAPRLTLPQSWTLGDVINAIVAHNVQIEPTPLAAVGSNAELGNRLKGGTDD